LFLRILDIEDSLLTYGRLLDSLGIVLRCIGRAVTILALCCAIGLHWIALQSVAWTTMLIQNAKCAPLPTAIARTFDGSHPCSLCHIVNKGKDSERKSDLQPSAPKIDIICMARPIRLLPPFADFEHAAQDFSFSESGHSPPVPPPRFVS
jgi:hypothetical protein